MRSIFWLFLIFMCSFSVYGKTHIKKEIKTDWYSIFDHVIKNIEDVDTINLYKYNKEFTLNSFHVSYTYYKKNIFIQTIDDGISSGIHDPYGVSQKWRIHTRSKILYLIITNLNKHTQTKYVFYPIYDNNKILSNILLIKHHILST